MNIPQTLPDAVFILETPSSPLDARLNALRFIQSYVEADRIPSVVDRMKINQLVLDSIMLILNREDRLPDLRKRQLVRTECFLMLAKILDSKSLFAGVSPASRGTDDNAVTYSTNTASASTRREDSKVYHSKDDSTTNTVLVRSQSTGVINTDVPKDETNEKDELPAKSTDSTCTDDNTVNSYGSKSSVTSVTSTSSTSSHITLLSKTAPVKHAGILANALTKPPHRSLTRQKFLKPRQSVLTGSKAKPERLVPGVNPYNMYEMDKRLGYQKSRIWVPQTGPGLSSNLAPLPRARGHMQQQADKIAEDYQRMQAMLSYVSDLVVPFDPKKSKRAKFGKSSDVLVDANMYKDAVKEAVLLWTPLLGMNLPQWAQHTRNGKVLMHTISSSAAGRVVDNAPLHKSPSVAPHSVGGAPTPPPSVMSPSKAAVLREAVAVQQKQQTQQQMAMEGARSIIITKNTLKQLLREELQIQNKNKILLRRTLEEISSGDGVEAVNASVIQKLQNEMQQNLQSEKNTHLKSIQAMKALMLDTVKIQYSSLPPRYLLVVDRGNARSREVFQKAMKAFCRVKRLNYLALAMGIWKIILLQQETVARRPKYAKIASVHLIQGWLQDRKTKQINLWFTKWREIVSKSIFLERERAALPIQCLYRWWRDRKKFIQLHLAGPYNGPLSDIYLGPHRLVLYFIPRIIRSTRRMLWQAAILIQTQWRRFFIQKDYLVQLRRVLLLQSIVRMYPKWVQYRRLKATTIKCQSWARRTIKRNWFKKLKFYTIIAQKYIRRYLCILLKHRLLNCLWQSVEEPMEPVIKIQCQWRIYLAKKKCKAIRHHIARRQWAALVMQRNWYRHTGAYHTFVLMCAYRMMDIEDDKLEQMADDMARYYSSRKIQRVYRVHYNKRIISSLIKLQCWFRGTRGLKSVSRLRRIKWASRKLHHWARGMMKYKHRCSRIIARAWWFCKSGRFIRHMYLRAKWLDDKEDAERWAIEYKAAERIQSLCHGFTARRFVVRHRAAFIIQRPMKFFIARLMWHKKFRDEATGMVRKVVGNIIGRGLMNVTRLVVAEHNMYIRRVQCRARGYLVRMAIRHAKVKAREMGISVIKLQRFWRRSGAFVKAVQEVMALKRLDSNPYRECQSAHDVLVRLRVDVCKYYHVRDPRAGLLTSAFLRRLGMSDLLPMFPTKQYKYAADLRQLNVDKLTTLYTRWMKKEEKSANKDTNVTSRAVRAKSKPPKAAFQEIMSHLWPSIPPRNAKGREAILDLFAVQEIISQENFEKFVTVNFVKRFGAAFSTRAENLAKSLASKAWHQYSNYKSVGYVLTKSQVTRALVVPKVPSEVRALIEEMSSPPDVLTKDAIAEKQWDLDRLKACAECLQMAVEKLSLLLPEGYLRDLITAAAVEVSNYKRRFLFVVAKAKEREEKKKAEEAFKAAMAKKGRKNSRKSPSKPQLPDDEIIINEGTDKVATVAESVERPFYGSMDDIDLELNVGICKLYFNALEKLTQGDSAVTSIKNLWYNRELVMKFKRERVAQFLSDKTDEYTDMRTTNHVHKTWLKLRRIEQIQWKLDAIHAARHERLEVIRMTLEWIPRYGWQEELDPSGYAYWTNSITNEESTYEMPQYTAEEWNAATRIQWTVQRWLVKVYQRKREREAARLEALANHEKLMVEEFGRTQRAVTVTVGITKRLISSIRNVEAEESVEDTSPESFLPFKYKFMDTDVFHPHEWVLLKMESTEDEYKTVIILKLSKTKLKYDVRLVTGAIVKNVSPNRLFKMNYDVGSLIEARYKGDACFYRGTIVAIQLSPVTNEYEYTIRYDDGEKEVRVPRNLIRPSPKGIKAFFKERNRLMHFYAKREERAAHYANLRKARLLEKGQLALHYEEQFKDNWKSALRLPDSRNSIPGQAIRGMIHAAEPLRQLQYSGFCRVYYTKVALRYGWYEVKEGSKGAEETTYHNQVTGETMRVPPLYSPGDHFHAMKIQSVWAVYKAKKFMRKLLMQDSIGTVVASAIIRYQQVAYIGEGLEGVSIVQMLHRTGYVEVAEAVSNYFHSKPSASKEYTFEDVMHFTKDKFVNIGITRHGDVRDFTKLQEWWKNTPVDKRTQAVTLINYFTGPDDPRTIKECILASEQAIKQRLNRAYRNSVSRIQNISAGMLESNFPITKMQFDSFLDRYPGKPALAQQNVDLIVDKPTTSTYVEEREAYMILKGATRRLIAICRALKINIIRKVLVDALQRADNLIVGVDHEYENSERPRERITGPEAKACLILRRDVMAYIQQVEDATFLVQKRVRGIGKRLRYLRISALRLKACILVQSFVRRMSARIKAANLRVQQNSDWEQLWNDRDKCLYYYNRAVGVSTYEEPLEPYRPLVRDLRSDALIQAWPHLDTMEEGQLSAGSAGTAFNVVGASTASFLRDNTVCVNCEERKTMRVCFECQPPGKSPQKRGRRQPVPYCFPCFASIHSNDPTRINHKYQDLDDQLVEYLTCCECAEPATRKCMGILDDKEIDDLCSKLHRANSQNWGKVLKAANVGGERRLAIMMDQLSASGAGEDGHAVFLNPSQLQQVRMMLERTRAECDECYCERCYKDIHSNGKRAFHRWVGFAPKAPVCGVCDRSPAELSCRDCNNALFCRSCYKVFHNKGRKRKHISDVMKEDMPPGTMACYECERRPATESCPDCSIPFCNSCMECIHVRKCSVRLAKEIASDNRNICVSCGEEADQKCVECGDLYCSRTWMGNPGCFLTYHSKGNRVSHTTVPLQKEDPVATPATPAKPAFDDASPHASKKKKSKSKIVKGSSSAPTDKAALARNRSPSRGMRPGSVKA